MSRKVYISDFTDKELYKISNDLNIAKEASKYSMSTKPDYICLFENEGNDLYVPFCYNETYSRPERASFPSTNIVFTGSLREEQKEVKNEAIKHLNTQGTTLISAACGFGKCLQKNTPILMYDGSVKLVQDVITGDKVMGDDSTHRNVLSTVIGQEKMYKIISETGESFGCNESHILTLKILGHKTISYSNNRYIVKRFRKDILNFYESYYKDLSVAQDAISMLQEDCLLDISLKDYIKLPEFVKTNLRIHKICTEFPYKNTPENPYVYIMKNNTNHILPEYKYNNIENRTILCLGIIEKYGKQNNNYYEFIVNNKGICKDIIYVLNSLGIHTSVVYGFETHHIKAYFDFKKDKIYSTIDPTFIIIEIPETTYYGFTIDGNGRFLLGNFTVTHNTAMSIYIASKINLKTLVLCHRIVLINQWKDSIQRFCPDAKVQILSSKSDIKNNTDFFIINASNVSKHTRDFYKDIGFVIVDEAHLIMAEKLSYCMRYLLPRYLLGLSATPYRTDGLNVLMELYFGKNRIERKLFRKHIVYRINTGIKPDVKLNRMGKVDWGSVIDSISNNKERNEMIITLIKKYSDNVFLVLCKRVSQAEYIVNRLKEEGEDVTSLIGCQQEYEQKSRILVGTAQKVGTGFDHPLLNSLILACDVEQYFIQYLGRVFRRKDTEPCIFDFVDDFNLLIKHYRTRNSVYIEHGGQVKDFLREFPNFFKKNQSL